VFYAERVIYREVTPEDVEDIFKIYRRGCESRSKIYFSRLDRETTKFKVGNL